MATAKQKISTASKEWTVMLSFHTLSPSFTSIFPFFFSYSLFIYLLHGHFLSLIHTNTHSIYLSLLHTHTRTYTYTHTHKQHTHSISFCLSLTHTHTHTHRMCEWQMALTRRRIERRMRIRRMKERALSSFHTFLICLNGQEHTHTQTHTHRCWRTRESTSDIHMYI